MPGVFGIMDELACRHRPGADGEAIKEAVAAALARSAIADVADLAVDAQCSGTVVLSGAVHSRSCHDLAIATAWSVADVKAVDDCIRVES
ncbi:MAG TPA: BON domain-containing protein [Acidimicrobiales bacterium]